MSRRLVATCQRADSGDDRGTGEGVSSRPAPQFVGREVDAVLSRRRASPHLRGRVVARAIEEVLDLLADDVRYAEPRRQAGLLAA